MAMNGLARMLGRNTQQAIEPDQDRVGPAHREIVGFAAHACATTPNTQTPHDRHVPANTTTVSP